MIDDILLNDNVDSKAFDDFAETYVKEQLRMAFQAGWNFRTFSDVGENPPDFETWYSNYINKI